MNLSFLSKWSEWNLGQIFAFCLFFVDKFKRIFFRFFVNKFKNALKIYLKFCLIIFL